MRVTEPMRRAAEARQRKASLFAADGHLGASRTGSLAPEAMHRLISIFRGGAEFNAAYRTCRTALSRSGVGNERLLSDFATLMAARMTLAVENKCVSPSLKTPLTASEGAPPVAAEVSPPTATPVTTPAHGVRSSEPSTEERGASAPCPTSTAAVSAPDRTTAEAASPDSIAQRIKRRRRNPALP